MNAPTWPAFLATRLRKWAAERRSNGPGKIELQATERLIEKLNTMRPGRRARFLANEVNSLVCGMVERLATDLETGKGDGS